MSHGLVAWGSDAPADLIVRRVGRPHGLPSCEDATVMPANDRRAPVSPGGASAAQTAGRAAA
jgi:hypothetical protein